MHKPDASVLFPFFHLSPHPRPSCLLQQGVLPMQSPPSQSDPVKKQEDDDKAEKRDVKPLPKTLNRVPRKSTQPSITFQFL